VQATVIFGVKARAGTALNRRAVTAATIPTMRQRVALDARCIPLIYQLPLVLAGHINFW
jgi:hypothetical protein